MKISIIIPIYNVEEYLDRCLKSVQQQTYGNLQVILVDDGATDGSVAIAQLFVDKDSRFRLIHQANQGLSAARNTGLGYVDGDYVFYLDSDDYLESTCIQVLVERAIENQADIVQANFYYDYSDYLLYNDTIKDDFILFNRSQAMAELVKQGVVKNFAWGKLMKTQLAKQHLFPTGKFFEDIFWKYLLIHDISTYVVLAKPLIFYLQRQSGISGVFSERNLDQLEGEMLRLDFIAVNYPKIYGELLLLNFVQSLINYKVNSEKLPHDLSYRYDEEIFKAVKKYSINKRFILQYYFIKFRYLRNVYVLMSKVQNRFFNPVKWRKIKKY